MEASTSTRGRGRKRLAITAPSSSNISSEANEGSSSITPVASMAPSALILETPSPSATRETRNRSRQAEPGNGSPDDLSSKGGRSLRKRPRVDYTFDQLEDIDSTNAQGIPGATRSVKRRRTDISSNEIEIDEEVESGSKRRASEQPTSVSSRRRNPTRKSTAEPQMLASEPQADEVEVQDTIEVGGHHSEASDESQNSMLQHTSVTQQTSILQQTPAINTNSIPPNTSTSLNTLAIVPYQNSNSEVSSGVNAEEVAVSRLSKDKGKGKATAKDQTAGQEEIENEEVEDEEVRDDSLDHLTPYIDGAYVYYPEYEEDEPEAEMDPEQEVEAEAEPNGQIDPEVDGEVELNAANEDGAKEVIADDQGDGPAEETPADSAADSPSMESELQTQKPVDRFQKRFRQARSAEEFTELFTDIKSLSTKDLHYRLEVVNRALVAWQNEFKDLKRITDDEDNAIRYQREEQAFQRRYKTAVGKNPDANPLRKDFVPKSVRVKHPEDPEAEYIRQQDRIEASVYGFEYDPRADRMGNQDPIAQRTGIGRAGRLRERPKQTAKAAEAEEPVLPPKRTRKAPEKYTGGDAISRGSTPAPTQRRGRRGAQVQENGDEVQLLAPAATLNVPASAAEAEPPKKKGKGGRPRKNQVKEPTPILEEIEAPEAIPEPEAEPEPTNKSRSKAKPKAKSKAKPKATPTPAVEPTPEPQSPPKRKAETVEEESSRKRRRRGPASVSTSSPPPAPALSMAVEEQGVSNGTEIGPPAKPIGRRNNSRKPSNAAASFSSSPTTSSKNDAEEPRPPTASSTATAETTVSTSNYSFREKRQRKFTNDIPDEDLIELPKAKRVRRAAPTKKVKTEETAPSLEPPPEQSQGPTAPTAEKPPTRIVLKYKNSPLPGFASTTSAAPQLTSNAAANSAHASGILNGGANSHGTVNGALEAVGGDEDAEAEAEPAKDYNSMTKSEKMSNSMKGKSTPYNLRRKPR